MDSSVNSELTLAFRKAIKLCEKTSGDMQKMVSEQRANLLAQRRFFIRRNNFRFVKGSGKLQHWDVINGKWVDSPLDVKAGKAVASKWILIAKMGGKHSGTLAFYHRSRLRFASGSDIAVDLVMSGFKARKVGAVNDVTKCDDITQSYLTGLFKKQGVTVEPSESYLDIQKRVQFRSVHPNPKHVCDNATQVWIRFRARKKNLSVTPALNNAIDKSANSNFLITDIDLYEGV